MEDISTNPNVRTEFNPGYLKLQPSTKIRFSWWFSIQLMEKI